MLSDKGTNIFSEIGKFFKENDATSAMNAIIDITKALRLSEKRLFGSESKCNCKLTQLQVLGLLMLFPCFMIRNAYNYGKSSLSSLFDCRKDVFYRFISNESYDWRKILATVSLQLWNKTQEKRTCDSTEPVCLMVDDTDYPKRGIQTELIGKIYSHVTHSMMLGFKGLFIGITDGISQMLLDFALVGEEGKKGNYGLKQKQLDARFSKEHAEGSHTAKRIEEYNQSKIALMIEMIRRIIKRKIHFDYVLADSWFACAEVILFITSRHVRCHYLGMIKMGKTKYTYKGKEYTANQLVSLFDKPKKGRSYSRRLGCYYITVDGGRPLGPGDGELLWTWILSDPHVWRLRSRLNLFLFAFVAKIFTQKHGGVSLQFCICYKRFIRLDRCGFLLFFQICFGRRKLCRFIFRTCFHNLPPGQYHSKGGRRTDGRCATHFQFLNGFSHALVRVAGNPSNF